MPQTASLQPWRQGLLSGQHPLGCPGLRAFPRPILAWKGDSDPHPRAAGVAPPGGVSRECSRHPDHSSHPTSLPKTSPPTLRVSSRKWGGGRLEEGQAAFLSSPTSRGQLASSIAAPHPGPKHTGWGRPPRPPEGEGRGAAVTDTYLCPSSRTATPATQPRSGALAPGAKQAFIAALAARMRRRAAQIISKTEGNCSPASWSPRLLSQLRTIFPRSTVETLEEVQAAPPFHCAPGSAPSSPELLRSCLESSPRTCVPVSGREGWQEPSVGWLPSVCRQGGHGAAWPLKHRKTLWRSS